MRWTALTVSAWHCRTGAIFRSVGRTTPGELRTICLRLAGRYFSSALEFSRLPLDELRLWIDAAVKESRKQ